MEPFHRRLGKPPPSYALLRICLFTSSFNWEIEKSMLIFAPFDSFRIWKKATWVHTFVFIVQAHSILPAKLKLYSPGKKLPWRKTKPGQSEVAVHSDRFVRVCSKYSSCCRSLVFLRTIHLTAQQPSRASVFIIWEWSDAVISTHLCECLEGAGTILCLDGIANRKFTASLKDNGFALLQARPAFASKMSGWITLTRIFQQTRLLILREKESSTNCPPHARHLFQQSTVPTIQQQSCYLTARHFRWGQETSDIDYPISLSKARRRRSLWKVLEK